MILLCTEFILVHFWSYTLSSCHVLTRYIIAAPHGHEIGFSNITQPEDYRRKFCAITWHQASPVLVNVLLCIGPVQIKAQYTIENSTNISVHILFLYLISVTNQNPPLLFLLILQTSMFVVGS